MRSRPPLEGAPDAQSPVAGAASPPSYPYVAIDVDEDLADDAAALLFELGADGVEWRDGTTLARAATAGKVTLVASFRAEDDASVAVGELSQEWSPRVEYVVGDAWRDEWKKHFEPFRIAGNIVVSPPWRAYAPNDGETVLVLEPGRAFGTGLHETTSLVAEVLSDRAAGFQGKAVLDVGCGSGILSIVALALGAKSARAIDVDPEAWLTTRENAARNGMGDRVWADGESVESVPGQYAAVVANIEAKTLVDIAPALWDRVAPKGILVLSGILAPHVVRDQLGAVRRAYAHAREPRHNPSLVKGEWAALVFEKW